MPALTDSWTLGGVRVPNRVMLAPLAGIGSWFVRLQAKRYGAGMAVSEMVSSHAIHYRNERTCEEMLRIHPAEREHAGPVSIQLFGPDPEIMRSAAAVVAEKGADIIDLNMGCPVPKVCKTGAGAALLSDPDRAVAVARAAREASGLPVTVKLRPGQTPDDRKGVELAYRLVDEAGVAGLGFHPRHAAQHHQGGPDYELAARLVEELPVPVILSGGLRSPREGARRLRADGRRRDHARARVARQPVAVRAAARAARRRRRPHARRGRRRARWTMDRAEEHFGTEKAARNLRKFYAWYLERLGGDKAAADALQRAPTLADARAPGGRSGAPRRGLDPRREGRLTAAILPGLSRPD